jgi:tRNA-specific 2-thiouridylase
MKVIVGMSGGVDSSVAAWLLKEQGYAVEGVSLVLEEQRIRSESACCSLESLEDARKTAEQIGIPHRMVNLRGEFADEVIGPFITAYESGFTPNPCILCNERIKFPALVELADALGAGCIATGHYARVADGRLLKGVDPKKDQSYVLYVLGEAVLGRLLLPLGGMRKDEVRSLARSLGLVAAERPESQDICFVGGRGYADFLSCVGERREGRIIDAETGRVLGMHHGIHSFTPGQRKRLGVATGKPLFVTRIDPFADAVYVGPRHLAEALECCVGDVRWLPSPGSFAVPTVGSTVSCSVKVRSTMEAVPAVLSVTDERQVCVSFKTPQWAPAPGQSAVFYDGDAVLGGGEILRSAVAADVP